MAELLLLDALARQALGRERVFGAIFMNENSCFMVWETYPYMVFLGSNLCKYAILVHVRLSTHRWHSSCFRGSFRHFSKDRSVCWIWRSMFVRTQHKKKGKKNLGWEYKNVLAWGPMTHEHEKQYWHVLSFKKFGPLI